MYNYFQNFSHILLLPFSIFLNVARNLVENAALYKQTNNNDKKTEFFVILKTHLYIFTNVSVILLKCIYASYTAYKYIGYNYRTFQAIYDTV